MAGSPGRHEREPFRAKYPREFARSFGFGFPQPLDTVLGMLSKCLACGVEKDPAIKEVYPYPESERLITTAIDPLLELDCQGGPLNDGSGYSDFRRVLVCHHCFEKLSPDMWIGQSCWESLNPITPFEQLPPLPE